MKYIILFLSIFCLLISCQTESDKAHHFEPPIITKQESRDNYFGYEIIDPYRNLEDTQDSTNIEWYKNQTTYSNEWLNKIENRDSLIEYLYEIDNRKSFYVRGNVTTPKGNRFYRKKNVGENYYKLYYKRANDSTEHVLFDPRQYKKESGEIYSINYSRPSWDEKHIVVSLSHSGKEISELKIVDVETKEVLPVTLENAWPSSFLGINWLPDSSGFTYLYFPETDSGAKDFKRNSHSVLYFLGQNPKKVNYIFGNQTNRDFDIAPSEYPCTKIRSSSDQYIIGYIAGVDTYWKAYFAKIDDIKNGKTNWKPLYSVEDKVDTNESIFRNDRLIFITGKNSPNYQIAQVKAPDFDFENMDILFTPNENEVIKTFEVTKDGIYVVTTKFGLEANLHIIKDDKVEQLGLPNKAGNVNLTSYSVNSNDIWVSLSGWTSKNERYKYDLNKSIFTPDNLSESANYPEFENIEFKQVMVKSHDGTEVPLSIIFDKKKITKNTPTLIEAYGAYGDATSPYFSPLLMGWISKGGIFCTAHIRGGGEKGEEWHQAGLKTTKPNSWKDLIACSEYMITEGYTTKANLAIYGASAGGIVVGRAMTERPDLYAAVVSEYGVLNPLRMESQPGGGGSNIKEFGTVNDSIESRALIEMDAYTHIQDSIDYPATYLTVGMNDPRVMPWESGKFAARLQNANNLKKPVLLMADFDAGHEGNNNSERKIYEEWGNVFSFVFWQTGHPDYQLKEGSLKN